MRLLLHLSVVAVLVCVLAACATIPAKQPLPCRSPVELKQALQYCLNSNDTNYLWQLYAWTNVSSKSERIEKRLQLRFLPEDSGDQCTYKSFRIILADNLPPDIKGIVERTNYTKPHFNIPVEGVIYCNLRSYKRSDQALMDGIEFPFGKTVSGDYVLAVLIPGTSKESSGRH